MRQGERRRRSLDRSAKRVSRACDNCRARKTRCDSRQPICTECETRGSICVYTGQDKRRKYSTTRQSDASSSAAAPQPQSRELRRKLDQRHLFPPAAAGSASRTVPTHDLADTSTSFMTDANLNSVANETEEDSQIMPPNVLTLLEDLDWADLGMQVPSLSALGESPGKSLSSINPSSAASNRSLVRRKHVASSSPLIQTRRKRFNGATALCSETDDAEIIFRLPQERQGGGHRLQEEYWYPGKNDVSESLIPLISSSGRSGSLSRSSLSYEMRSRRRDLIAHTYPHLWVLQELVPLFFQHFGDQFPFFNMEDFRLAFVWNEQSGFLLNSMCSVSARFSKHKGITLNRQEDEAHTFGIDFAEQAQRQLCNMLLSPNEITVQALLLLAWHEYSVNCEARMWMFSGMAARLAIDLGLNTRQQDDKTNRLFWCVYITNTYIAICTGRSKSIKDEDVLIPNPDPNDTDTDGYNVFAFAYFVRISRIAGRLADIANKSTGINQSQDSKSLEVIEAELLQWQNELPDSLRSGSRQLSETKEPRIFIQVHLWFYCLLMIIRSIRLKEDVVAIAIGKVECFQVEEQASQRCSEILQYSMAIDSSFILSCPFVASAWCTAIIVELEKLERLSKGNSNTISEQFLRSQPLQNIQSLNYALKRIQKYWLGCSTASFLMKTKARQFAHLTELVNDLGESAPFRAIMTLTDSYLYKSSKKMLMKKGQAQNIEVG